MPYTQYTVGIGTVHMSIYHVSSRKCACKGTGLVPLTSETKVVKGRTAPPQAFCPIHKATRYWPQLQADDSVEFKELDGFRGLKERRR